MKDFNDYQVADISEESREQITNLEKEIEQETGNKIVLIAYQEEQ